VDDPERDPLDEDDDLHSALAIKPEGWSLRSSETGEEVPVSREEMAGLLAAGRRMRVGLGPETPEYDPGTD
jgi:hypothetical protein